MPHPLLPSRCWPAFALRWLCVILLGATARAQERAKGTPNTPEQIAAHQAMYRRDVAPVLEKIEKALPSRSVPKLIDMLAPDSPFLASAKPGYYQEFLPATFTDTVYYLVTRDANRLVIQELSKRVATERETFEKYAADPQIKFRHIFTGSGGPPLNVEQVCKSLLETGKYP